MDDLLDWFLYIPSYIAGVLYGILKAAGNLFISIIKTVFGWFFELVGSLFDLAGISEYFDVLNDDFSDSLGYFLDIFLVPQALSALGFAYIIRFLIRRLPVIG